MKDKSRLTPAQFEFAVNTLLENSRLKDTLLTFDFHRADNEFLNKHQIQVLIGVSKTVYQNTYYQRLGPKIERGVERLIKFLNSSK